MESENDKIEIGDELIVRYLAGEARPEEADALHDWMEYPSNRLHFESICSAWNKAHPLRTPRRIDTGNAWEKLSEEIGPTEKHRVTFLQRHRSLLQIAASLLIATIAGIWIYAKIRYNDILEISVSVKEFSQRIEFPDKSEVTLCRNAVLLYPKTFKKQFREVRLVNGEAFFSIARDEQKPFIIHTPVADIKVIGTAFNVVLSDDQLEVSVKEGKVLVYTSNDSSYLPAGFTGIIRPDVKLINVKDSINVNTWGYATRTFTFKDASMAEVISTVEKAYPHAVRLRNEDINNCKLTATFNNVSVEKMLNLIAETLNLSVARNDTLFILEGEGCP